MTRCPILFVVVFLGCLGCQSQFLRTANQDLERENFQLEQRVDQLTWELADAKAALIAYQNGGRGPILPVAPASPLQPPRGRFDPAVPPSSGSGGGGVGSGGAEQGPPRVELPDEGARAPRSRRREPVPRFTGPPIISPPNAEMPEGELRRPPQVADAEELPADAQPPDSLRTEAPTYQYADQGENQNASAAEARLVSRGPDEPVSSLVVNPRLTVWRRRSGDAATDKGLKLVVEPHSATGALVAAGGDVAVAVLDPSQEGPAARLARWDFSADEAETHFRGAQPGGGLHFVLAWPSAAPESEDLLLFVRLTTPEGQQFVAEYALRPASDSDQASWSEDAEQERPLLTAARQRASVGWQRATRPIDPSEYPAVNPHRETRGGDSEIRDSAAEPASVIEAAGPTWAPYR